MCCKQYLGHGQDYSNITEYLNHPMYFKEERDDISML